MRWISSDPLNRFRFPVDNWRFVEVEPGLDDLGVTGALFSIGNGCLGIRGNPEERHKSYLHGTFIDGFYEAWTIRHAEEAFGFANTGQTIVNVPGAKLIKVYVDDEPLTLGQSDLDHYERALDFRVGCLIRDLVWRTLADKRVKPSSRRMVNLTGRHPALFEIELTMLEGNVSIMLNSRVINRQDGFDNYHQPRNEESFDPRRADRFNDRALQPRGQWHDDQRMAPGYETTDSHVTLCVAAKHTLGIANPYEVISRIEEDQVKQVYHIEARGGVPIIIRKTVACRTSRGVPVTELFDRCRRTLDRVSERDFDSFFEGQRAWLDNFWTNSDVEVGGQPTIQQAARWCLFQLAQATTRPDQLGIPAKGMTGSGYEGHYFWDTEIYLVPFLAYTALRITHNALRYQVGLLPKARERAQMLSQEGALFPWRTINGEEASAYYAVGTAQYHIDADTAHVFAKYHEATGDMDFLYRDGTAALVEITWIWADLGLWRAETDGSQRFHIRGVTGPDEYTAVVNNNMFTNVMTHANLKPAADLVQKLEEAGPLCQGRLVQTLGVTPEEMKEWRACAKGMVIPFDETFGIHPQDEKFLPNELWNLENTPADRSPLLLHFHPLVIYRFQVPKQADMVLALFLQGDQFIEEQKRADFEYYDPITMGDSTLSGVVQSVIAAEVSYRNMAMQYSLMGLYVGLADLHANPRDGVHIVSAGEVQNALVFGFGGLRDYHDDISFDPWLPKEWEYLCFPLQVREPRLWVLLEREAISFEVKAGGPLEANVRGQRLVIQPGVPTRVPLEHRGEELPLLAGRRPVTGGHRFDGSVIAASVPEVPHDRDLVVVD